MFLLDNLWLYTSEVSIGTVVHVTDQTLTVSNRCNVGVISFPGAANVTGQALTLALGTNFSVTGTASISLTGFSATLSLADVLVWGKVIPGVTTTYANVNTSNTPTWTTVTTGASQTWTEEKR